jgi:hypothetical protein
MEEAKHQQLRERQAHLEAVDFFLRPCHSYTQKQLVVTGLSDIFSWTECDTD